MHKTNVNLRNARIDLTEGCFPGSSIASHTHGPLSHDLLPEDLTRVQCLRGGGVEPAGDATHHPGCRQDMCYCSIRTNPKLLQICTSHALESQLYTGEMEVWE